MFESKMSQHLHLIFTTCDEVNIESSIIWLSFSSRIRIVLLEELSSRTLMVQGVTPFNVYLYWYIVIIICLVI